MVWMTYHFLLILYSQRSREFDNQDIDIEEGLIFNNVKRVKTLDTGVQKR